MPNIYLSSFTRALFQGGIPEGVERWSAAVYAPRGAETLPKAAWADIRDSNGQWIRPRNFIGADNPPAAYREALLDRYRGRRVQAERWLSSLDGDAALLCWCPYDKAAQRQLGQWGSFICHTAVLGEFLASEFHVPVWYDTDRLTMMVLTQKGIDVDMGVGVLPEYMGTNPSKAVPGQTKLFSGMPDLSEAT